MWTAYVYTLLGSGEEPVAGPFVVSDINLTWRLGERCSGTVTLFDHLGWFFDSNNRRMLVNYRYHVKLLFGDVPYINLHINEFSLNNLTQEVVLSVVDVGAELDYYMFRLFENNNYIYDFNVVVSNNVPPEPETMSWYDFLQLFSNSTGYRWNFVGSFPLPPSGWNQYGFPVYDVFEFHAKYLTVNNAIRKFADMFKCPVFVDPNSWVVFLNSNDFEYSLGTIPYLEVKQTGKRIFDTVGSNIRTGVLVGNDINNVSIMEYPSFPDDPDVYTRNIHVKSPDEAEKMLGHTLFDFWNILDTKDRAFYYEIEMKTYPMVYGPNYTIRPGCLVVYDNIEYKVISVTISRDYWTLQLVERIKTTTKHTFQSVREEVLKDFFRYRVPRRPTGNILGIRTLKPSVVAKDDDYPYISEQLCSFNSIFNAEGFMWFETPWFVWQRYYGVGLGDDDIVTTMFGRRKDGTIVALTYRWGVTRLFEFTEDGFSLISEFNLELRLLWDYDINGEDEVFLYDGWNGGIWVYDLYGQVLKYFSVGQLPLSGDWYQHSVAIGDFDNDNRLELAIFLQPWWTEDDPHVYLIIYKQFQGDSYLLYETYSIDLPEGLETDCSMEYLIHQVENSSHISFAAASWDDSTDYMLIISWDGEMRYYLISNVNLYDCCAIVSRGIAASSWFSYGMFKLKIFSWNGSIYDLIFETTFSNTDGEFALIRDPIYGDCIYAGNIKLMLSNFSYQTLTISDSLSPVCSYVHHIHRFGFTNILRDTDLLALWVLPELKSTRCFYSDIDGCGIPELIDFGLNVYKPYKQYQYHRNIYSCDSDEPFMENLRIRDFRRPFNYNPSITTMTTISVPDGELYFEPLTLRVKDNICLYYGNYIFLKSPNAWQLCGSLPDSLTYPICLDLNSNQVDEIVIFNSQTNAIEVYDYTGSLLASFSPNLTFSYYSFYIQDQSTFWFSGKTSTNYWYVYRFIYVHDRLILDYYSYRYLPYNFVYPYIPHAYSVYGALYLYFTDFGVYDRYYRWVVSPYWWSFRSAQRPTKRGLNIFPWLANNSYDDTILISIDFYDQLYCFFNTDLDQYYYYTNMTSGGNVGLYACEDYLHRDRVLVPPFFIVTNGYITRFSNTIPMMKPVRLAYGWYYVLRNTWNQLKLRPVPGVSGPEFDWTITLNENERVLPIDLTGDTFISFIKFDPTQGSMSILEPPPIIKPEFIPIEEPITNTQNYTRYVMLWRAPSHAKPGNGAIGFADFRNIILKIPLTFKTYARTPGSLMSPMIWYEGSPHTVITSKMVNLTQGTVKSIPIHNEYVASVFQWNDQWYCGLVANSGCTLYIINLHTHDILWSFTVNDPNYILMSAYQIPLVPIGNKLYIFAVYSNEYNIVYLLNLSSGEMITLLQTSEPYFYLDFPSVVIPLNDSYKFICYGFVGSDYVISSFDTQTNSFSYTIATDWFFGGSGWIFYEEYSTQYDPIQQRLFINRWDNVTSHIGCWDALSLEFLWSADDPNNDWAFDWNWDGQYLYTIAAYDWNSIRKLKKYLNGSLVASCTLPTDAIGTCTTLMCKIQEGSNTYDAIIIFFATTAGQLHIFVYDLDLNLRESMFNVATIPFTPRFNDSWTFVPINDQMFLVLYGGTWSNYVMYGVLRF